MGIPTSSSLLYKEVLLVTLLIKIYYSCLGRRAGWPVCIQEFEKMKEKKPENFRLDFAVSREQTNEMGEEMYMKRMAEYAEELWELLKKDNTFVYMCGEGYR